MNVETVFIALLLALSAGTPVPARAPQDPDAHFTGEERVTAVDVVVDFDLDRLRRGKSGRGAPKKLAPADFRVLYDGEPLPVVAVEPEAEPWTIVVYLDPVLTSSYGLAWAADLVTRHAEELTRLGSVEVVVADPVPRTVVAATRDPEHLHGVLSQVALRQWPAGEARTGAGRTELLAMRAEFLAEALHPTPAVDPQAFARWAAAEEVRMGRLRQDRLLDFLVEHAGEHPRRAVVLVSSGYDLAPGDFYLPAVDLGGEASAGGAPRLDGETEALARTLAAYGWIVVPLVPPAADPKARPGTRVGPWRMRPPTSFSMPGRAAFEEERDVDRAEAYLELGLALAGQGKPEDAEDAFKKALHHFYGDPRTAERQALAYLELGAVREELGKAELAERDYAAARELDPAQATERLGPVIELLAPAAPLGVLAEATAGVVVRDAEQLARTVENLGGRVRLTYQVTGLATGELRPVAVRFERDGQDLDAPRWARSATPATVAAARVRRLLAGDLMDGDFEVRAAFEPTEGHGADGAGDLTVRLAGEPFEAEQEVLLRVTWAAGAPDAVGELGTSSPEVVTAGAGGDWSVRRALTVGPDESLIAVLVEDLYSGDWGGSVLSVEDSVP